LIFFTIHGLRPLDCWNCRLESHRGHGWLSECCVLSGRGLCVGAITCPEECYRLWCVWVSTWNLDYEEALAN